MIRRLSTTAVALWLVAPACATSSEGEQARTETAHDRGNVAAACPAAVPGTQVTISETMDGVALTFHNPQRLDDVRDRARRMAEMHNQHHQMVASGESRPPGEREQMGMMAEPPQSELHPEMTMPPSRASVEDVEDGARVVLQPDDVADLDTLRAHARRIADEMQTGQCPMMMMTSEPAG